MPFVQYFPDEDTTWVGYYLDGEFHTTKGIRLRTHAKGECGGEFCSIHNPSEHGAAIGVLYWRDDRYLMERMCKHGIGHPDPDGMAYYAQTHTPYETAIHASHGCDGCCTRVDSKP